MDLTRRSFVAGTGAALAAAVTAAPVASAAPGRCAAVTARHGATAVADGVRLPALSEDGMVAMPRGFKAVRVSTIGVEPLLDDRGGSVIGTTPWGSWLSCEETTQRAGEQVTSSVDGATYTLQKDHGYVFEVFPAEVSRQVPRPITAWGRAVWEGAEIGPDRASAYLTEDTKGGLFFRWTAPAGVTLHAGIADQLGPQDGVLQAAQLVRDGEALGHCGQLTEADLGKAYPVRWIDGGEDRQAQESELRTQFPGATQHRKIEGVWTAADGQGLFFTLSRTSEGEFPGVVADQGMVVYYSFAEQTMTRVEHWAVGDYVDSPDNITVSPWGGVVIAEDGSDPNHLVAFTERTGSVALAKDLAERGEWAGPCFGTGGTLFANVQSDCTYLITGPLARHLAR